jgi:hypothetical protein
MPKGSSKKRKREDEAQAAVRIMETIIERTEEAETPIEITPEMRAAAAAFGRIGGKIGGPARAAKLSAKKRSEIAKAAAQARWKRQD